MELVPSNETASTSSKEKATKSSGKRKTKRVDAERSKAENETEQITGADTDDRLHYLRVKCQGLADERDALQQLAERTAVERDIILEDRREAAAKCQEAATMETELNAMRKKCERMAKHRESYISRTQRSEAKCERLMKVLAKTEVEAERFKAMCEAYDQHEAELLTLRLDCETITKQRNAHLVRAQREGNCADIIMSHVDALTRERDQLQAKVKDTNELEEQLNNIRLHCGFFESEKDDLKLKVRSMATDREKLRRDVEAVRTERDQYHYRRHMIGLLVKELAAEKQEIENLKKEKNDLMMRVQRAAADTEATRKESQALKHERKQVRAQCKNCAELAKQLVDKGERCKQVEEEISALKLSAHKTAAEKESLMKELESLNMSAGSLHAGGAVLNQRRDRAKRGSGATSSQAEPL
jgi:chromosome segregation ATPase